MNLYPIINPIIASLTNLPIVIENEPYTPAVRTAGWIRTTDLTSEPFEVTIGWDRMLQQEGIFQIDCMTPLNIGRTDNIDNLVAYFNNRDNRFYDGLEITYAWKGLALPDEKWHVSTCFFRYKYFV